MVDPALLLHLDQEMYGIRIAVPAYAPLQSIAEKMRALLQKLRHYEDGLAKGKHPDDAGLRGNFIPRHVLDLEILLIDRPRGPRPPARPVSRKMRGERHSTKRADSGAHPPPPAPSPRGGIPSCPGRVSMENA